MTDIKTYGFPEDLIPKEGPALPARVTAVFKGRWQLITPEGQKHAVLKTKEYIYDGGQEFPTAGDYVLALPAPGDWQIVRTLPRKSFFSRLDGWHGTEQAVAANMDLVFAVQSLNENFNLKRLERYLTLGWNSGASPIVLLTKADLPGDHGEMLKAARSISGEAPVFALSSKTGEGMDQLAPYLRPGITAAFLGSSGVGKSSLIDAVSGEEIMSVGGIREYDSAGRHTTTHRQLLLLKSGVLVIDTPGMRELGMWDAGEGLSTAFPDVEKFLGKCRFSDCKHESEPGCAVRAAIERGELDPARLESYMQLEGESERSVKSGRARRKFGQPSRALGKSRRQERRQKRKIFP